MRTPWLPVVDWTDAPADLNGLVRFAERRNLVSARVPSHFNWPLQPEARTSFCWLTYPHRFSYKNSRLSFTYQILNNRSASLFHYNKLCTRGFTKSLRGGKSQSGIFLMRLRHQLETMKWCEEIPWPSSTVVWSRSPYLEILRTVRLSRQSSSNLQNKLYAYIIIWKYLHQWAIIGRIRSIRSIPN